MKFTKGMILGSLITTGMIMVYKNSNMINAKKIMKSGRKVAKKMGII